MEPSVTRVKPLFPGTTCFPLSAPKKDKNKQSKIIQEFHAQTHQLEKIFEIIGVPDQEDLDQLEDGYMKSADGTRIHYGHVTTPVPKAAIGISHGFTECMPKYYEMIYYFAKAGYSVYMVEHRGHGYSDRSVSDMSMVTVNSFDDYVGDLDMFIREIVMKREGRRPRYLYGHSMGGAIAALYLEKHPEVFAKAVLSSPMIEMLYGNFSHFAVEAILFVARVLNWNDKYLPSQTQYTDEYDFESSCCLSRARYDYIYKCKVDNERYRTNGATYRWCRAGRKASKYIKKHVQEIKIPVL